MKLTIIVTGALKENYLKTAQEKYLGSLLKVREFEKVDLIELKDLPIKEKASKKDEERVKNEESNRVLNLINKEDYLVVLDVLGKEVDKDYFSNLKKRLKEDSKERLVFVIGGSLGLNDEIKKRAKDLISFSKLTYPHQLFRIVLLKTLASYL